MAKYLVSGTELSFNEMMERLAAENSYQGRNRTCENSLFELCNVLGLKRSEREVVQVLCNMYYNHGIATGVERAFEDRGFKL